MKACLVLICFVVGLFGQGLGVVAAEKQFSVLDQKVEDYERDNIQSIHKRIYSKEGRHELAAYGGGVLRSDGYVLGGASYTYHLFESLGFEANFAYGGQVYDENKMMLGNLNVQFAPLYGKFSLFTIAILTFDFTFTGGAGFVDRRGRSPVTTWMGNLGIGTRVFLNRYMAIRVDFRDYFHRDNLNATQDMRLENELTLTGGLSVFFPFKTAS